MGQSDELPYNYLDKQGRKHGYWKMFVDSNLNVVKDTSNAVWYYYNICHRDVTFCGFDNKFISRRDEEVVNFIKRPEHIKDSIIPLNGTFEVQFGEDELHNHNKKLQIKTTKSVTHTIVFDDGYIVNHFIKYGQYGTSWEKFFFLKKHKNNPYSFYYESPAPESSKIEKGYYYFIPGKKWARKEFDLHEVESRRHDAHLLEALYTGVYKSSCAVKFYDSLHFFTKPIDSVNYSTKRYNGALVIDSNRYVFEDEFQVTSGEFKVINDSIVEFQMHDFQEKETYSDHEDFFMLLEGKYTLRKEKGDKFLMKEDSHIRLEYKLKRHAFYK